MEEVLSDILKSAEDIVIQLGHGERQPEIEIVYV